jgi:predicted nucleotidyltransferase
MISQEEIDAIAGVARRYGVSRVLLFGSCLHATREPNDIDLAVEGIRPDQFFKFYGDLLFALAKPVDVVDLSVDTKFNRLVREEGVAIYG